MSEETKLTNEEIDEIITALANVYVAGEAQKVTNTIKRVAELQDKLKALKV